MTKTEIVTEEVIVRSVYVEEEEEHTVKDIGTAMREAKEVSHEKFEIPEELQDLDQVIGPIKIENASIETPEIAEAILAKNKKEPFDVDDVELVVDLQTIFTPLLSNQPYLMKMVIDE